MFTKDQLTVIRDRLNALLAQLTEIESQGADSRSTVTLDQARVGRLSRMDALQGQAMSQETQRRRQLQVRDVRRALKRLDTDCYGECTECGEEIAAARLDASPEVPLCISCASAAETN